MLMASRPFLIVAIDGGAASGKSSTARALSERFEFLHVDTGSFYRAITAEMLRRKVAVADLPALQAVLGAQVAAQTGLKVGDRFAGSHGLAGGGDSHGQTPYVVSGVLAPGGL